tara:strand:- start:216 stop:1121 length:906 start_codon:yes stop_codon:yes gene_type:complete
MNYFKKNYNLREGIIDFSISNSITSKVGKFYEEDPFPNYKLNDTKQTILEIGDKNILLKEFKKFIGYNKSLVEIGSGTCQLSNYLAIGTNNKVFAFDGSFQSLKLGKNFASKSNIKNIEFVRGDIFDRNFNSEVFDFIWCNGVLHHTKDPYEAFKSIIPSLKKNGYILLGLYNKIGRLRTKIRKYIYKFFGKKIVIKLDPVLRSIPTDSQDKIDAWIKDQYTHPVEYTHTYDEILKWFENNNIQFINSIPFCSMSETYKKNLFEKSSKGTYFERVLQQFLMIFSRHGSEGAIFIFIGKKIS